MRNRSIGLSALLLFLAMTVGCAPPPPYLRNYRFAPEPALAVMFKPGSQAPALSVMVSVIGIRRGDPDKSIPPAVELRMRFENNGKEPARFDPQTLVLVTGSLQSFAPPQVHPPTTIQIEPGQTQMANVFFQFPPGSSPATMPLDALRLRWEVQLEGKPYLQTVVFERASPLYYDAQ
jgi:hypothetical protein